MSIGKIKQFNSNEFARILLNNGFMYDGCKGSHKHYIRGEDLVIITNRNMNQMIARRLIKTYNLLF